MSHSKRRISTPLVLLWALAHGMWIGAGWHAGSQIGLATDAKAATAQHACSCNWHPAKSNSTSRLESQVSSAHACAICELGILAPEVPAAFQVATIAPSQAPRGYAQVATEVISAPTDLPPSRAPPVA